MLKYYCLSLLLISLSCNSAPFIESHTLQDNWNTITYSKVTWPAENSSQVICIAAQHCWIYPCVKTSTTEGNPNNCGSPMDQGNFVIYPNDTMIVARERWVKNYGVVSTFRVKEIYNKYPKGCTGMVIIPSGIGQSAQWLQGVPCNPLPPVNANCNTSDALNFYYTNLSSDAVNNAKAYGNMTLLCNKPVDVRITLVGPSEIDLGRAGTLRASLSINGTNLANGYSLKGGTTPTVVQVTSTLLTSIPDLEAGEFKGTGVIMAIYQ